MITFSQVVQPATLMTLSGCPEGLVSHKNIQYQKVCVYKDILYLYILAEISTHHLQLKHMSSHCFLAIPT